MRQDKLKQAVKAKGVENPEDKRTSSLSEEKEEKEKTTSETEVKKKEAETPSDTEKPRTSSGPFKVTTIARESKED